MGRHRRVRWLAAAVAVMGVAFAAPTGAIAADPNRWAEGTENMPEPPSAATLAKYRALNEHGAPVDESAATFDVTAAVITHTVYTRVAADEEYRAYYGSTGWKTFANSVVEYADDEMISLFGTDFYVQTFTSYDSYPDTSRSVCNLRTELDNEVSETGYDVVAGFSKNATSGSKGCAGGNTTITLWHGSATSTDERYAEWTVQRHEFSHLYGAPDRSTSLAGHPTDIMENQYQEPNYYCTTSGYNDWYIVYSNSDKYD